MIFASDNWAGASAPVAAALSRHSTGLAPAYGGDPLTLSVKARFSEFFECNVEVFFVPTGTAANALALSAYAKPGGVVFAHATAHVANDECNAPEFLTMGQKIRGLPGANGKLTPAVLTNAMAEHPDGELNSGQVAGLSLTQATECGTVYTAKEIRALADVAKSRGIVVHMDGARFANALITSGGSAADITWRAGVDVLSFGGTKNGCWCAEAVIFFNPGEGSQFRYLSKRAGHILSKSRFVAAQFEGYLEDGHWLDNARHANAMARRLADGLVRSGFARLAWPVEANEVFPVLPTHVINRLRAEGAVIREWPPAGLEGHTAPGADEALLRLVCSFATTEEEVERFLALAAG